VSRPSLTRHLLAWVLGALTLVWASFIAVGFRTGMHEADELTDGHLASVASILLSERDGKFVERRDAGSSVPPDLKRHDYQQSMSIVVWNAAGQAVTRSGDAPAPPFQTAEGFADLQLGDPPTPWRAFSQWDGPLHERKVMVLLSLKERSELAWDIAEQVVEPGLWLLPVIALALGLAIRRGLSPLYELSRDVHALDVNQAAPLKPRHPQAEFEAVVDSINQLVKRQQLALNNERQLASEMAHEMRTPLTSLALHARALRGAQNDAERAESLDRLEFDALRAGQVLAHLLALARASHTELSEAAQTLDLATLAGRVVGEYGEVALNSGHELALCAATSFPLPGHAVLLELALRNLIDNALSHTPRGTLVEVQLDARARWIQVCDNGAKGDVDSPAPARPAGRQALKLGLGLGLGHRVVEKVAAIHQGQFGRCEPPAGFTTCYRLTFSPGPGDGITKGAAPS
jgi:two-component system, OmpR family, sensor histidine kinase QseC